MKELKNDPVKAAQLAGASLSKNEIDTFKTLNFGGVELFNKISADRFMFIRKIDEDHDTDTDAKAQEQQS